MVILVVVYICSLLVVFLDQMLCSNFQYITMKPLWGSIFLYINSHKHDRFHLYLSTSIQCYASTPTQCQEWPTTNEYWSRRIFSGKLLLFICMVLITEELRIHLLIDNWKDSINIIFYRMSDWTFLQVSFFSQTSSRQHFFFDISNIC